jgi:thiamine biosynthesis protein ThiI
MKPIIVIRYGEISLKGKNRNFFENVLIKNLQKQLKDFSLSVHRRLGRVLIKLEEEVDQGVLKNKLEHVFGIENFSFGYRVDLDVDEMEKAAVKLLNETKDWKSFRIQSKRSNKDFPIQSMKLDRLIGSNVSDIFPEKKVQLKKPDVSIFVEVGDKEAYVSGKKHKGAGGLPVGVSADLLCLMSGGIDSPVAAWYAMKRGSRVHFVHFHSAPYTSKASIEKVEELVEILSQWQGPSTLINVPFIDVQKEIMKSAKSTYGVILYRRFMVRIAERFAQTLKAKGLITGEAVGQVASQTIENMTVVNDVADMPIIRPLVSFDKSEIMAVAERIGTYETSIVPHDDCCTLFVPKHPILYADREKTVKQEEGLEIESLIQAAMEKAEKKIVALLK